MESRVYVYGVFEYGPMLVSADSFAELKYWVVGRMKHLYNNENYSIFSHQNMQRIITDDYVLNDGDVFAIVERE